MEPINKRSEHDHSLPAHHAKKAEEFQTTEVSQVKKTEELPSQAEGDRQTIEADLNNRSDHKK